MKLTITLTKYQLAAAKRAEAYQRGEMPRKYDNENAYVHYMGDVDDLLETIFRAIKKAGAK